MVAPGTVSCYIFWQYSTLDINPEAVIHEVQLELFDSDLQLQLDVITLNMPVDSFTFTDLIPASNYVFTMLVRNDDGKDQLDIPIAFTTKKSGIVHIGYACSYIFHNSLCALESSLT